MATTTPPLFGRFLIEHGFVTQEQMLAALACQESNTPRAEAIADRMGILSTEKTYRIRTIQRTSGLGFLESASLAGILSAEQLQTIRYEIFVKRPRLGTMLVQLGYLSETDLDKAAGLFQTNRAGIAQIRSNLQKIGVFRDVDADALNALVQFTECVEVPAESKIVEEGSSARDIWGVIQGYLRVMHRKTPRTQDNREEGEVFDITGDSVYVSELGTGDLFGEVALFEGGWRSATVIAECEATLLRIEADGLRDWVRIHPVSAQPLLLNIIQTLTTRQRQLVLGLVEAREPPKPQQDVDSILEDSSVNNIPG
ncbi:cyclic nucleotide-binding domain-containing protein [Endothiovibrio diazotrophicus]